MRQSFYALRLSTTEITQQKKQIVVSAEMFSTYFIRAYFFLAVSLPVDCILYTSISRNVEAFEISEYFSIASCIVKLSKWELIWKQAVALNIEKNVLENEEAFYNQVIKQLNEHNMPFITIDATVNGTLDVSKANYMMIDYFEDCEEIMAFNFEEIDTDIKYLFIVQSSADCSRCLKSIGNIVFKYSISFFVKDLKGDYDLYTFFPKVNRDNCKVVFEKPLKINSCSKGILKRFAAFPSKVTTNLNKCPFKVGMGPLYPYAIIKNKENLQNYDRLDIDRVRGMDLEIIKILSERFNATLDLYYILKQEESPYINLEYLPLLQNGSLEACAGGLYKIFGDIVEYSGIYSSQSVMWIYSAKRVNMTWEHMAVHIDGLYLFILFYVAYCVVWCLICTFDKQAVSFGNTFLYSWGALVGTTSLPDAKSFKQKVLNMVYLNMCLHLSVYISIQLYSFLTIHGPPEMFNTNDEIMKSGRTPYLRDLTKYFVKDEKYEHFANTSINCAGFQDCAELSLLRKGVTAFISGYFYPFQAATAVNDEARMLRPVENLITVYYEMLIRKESLLVLKFQKTIVRVFEAGIADKLYKEAIGLTVIGKAKIASQNMMANSYACQIGCKLNMTQFYGVFYVWSFGCLASVCLFVIEILMRRSVKGISIQ